MIDKIAVLSLLVASLSFGVSATEGDEDAKEVPTAEMDNSAEQPVVPDRSFEEPKDKAELDELKAKKCQDDDRECDEEKMVKDEDEKPDFDPNDVSENESFSSSKED